MEKPSIISKESLLPLGLVFTLLAAAVSFGVMFNQSQQTREDIRELKVQIAKLDDKLDRLSERSIANQ